jgi:hypothetical protein
MRTRPLAVWAFWVLTALTVYPGVLLTDSLLATYFLWYPRSIWFTCAWYLPITVLPVPWMWKWAWGESSRVARGEARAAIERVAGHLGGRLVE